MFTPNDIKARLKQQPFEPFRLVTSSGESYDVPHPDLVLVGVNHLYVGTASKDDPGVFERTSRVALMHVNSLEDLPAKARKSKGNGRK